jgi:hypothetical protein
VFDALRSRAEADAAAVFQQIREGRNIEDIARQVGYGDLSLQVSLVPETRYRYEFPLSSKMPSHLLQLSNPYLNSLIYEWTSHHDIQDPRSDFNSQARQPSAASTEIYGPYLMPYCAAEIIDPQLSSIEPSRWTTVCTDNTLMRKLFTAYFLQDHDWWTAFQKDYFLEEMAQGRHDLCSSLLVNAVLAAACVSE